MGFPNAQSLPNGAFASLVLGQASFDESADDGGAAGLDSASGLALDLAGRLWVSDSSNNRILRFSRAAAPPTPAPPTPQIDTTPPVIAVKGRRSVDSMRNRVVFRGIASDASGIAGIEFKVSGQGGFQKARGTTRWKAVVRPDKNKRKTVVKVRAIDNAGNKSRFLKLKIFRR